MMKEKILEAALKVYLEKPNATIYEVAKMANVSKSTIFYYFKNKSGLEKELLLYVVNKYSPWNSNSLKEAIEKKLKLVEIDRRIARVVFCLIDNIYRNDKEFIMDMLEKGTAKVEKLLKKEGVCCKGSAIFLMSILDGILMYSMYGLANPAEYKNAVDIIVSVIKKYAENCQEEC